MTNLQLHATGFNAHDQLLPDSGVDIRMFTPIPIDIDTDSDGGAHARVLYTCWSTTILLTATHLVGIGHQHLNQRLDSGLADTLIHPFGDHDGLIGCLDTAGNLYFVSAGLELICQGTSSSPKLSCIAMAGNGTVTATVADTAAGLCQILQFPTINNFHNWFQNPASMELDSHVLHGQAKQLIANTATFLALTEPPQGGGDVYSWGDARFGSLGRSITASTPAERPGLIDALGGLKIVKIASGGWTSAALSEDGALYIWGTVQSPSGDKSLRPLKEAGAGEIVLVELPVAEGEEPLDIVDVGVGDNHIAAITADKRLFVIGDNDNGQLGLGSEEAVVEDWIEVPATSGGCHNVVCGPKATFVSFSEPG